MRSAGADGFVLVEALAALVITAVAAAGLLAALRSARDRMDEAGVRSLALREARHLLAEAESGDARSLAPEGRTADGRLTWTRGVTPLPSNSSLGAVVVEVTWTTRRRQGTTRLETYTILPR